MDIMELIQDLVQAKVHVMQMELVHVTLDTLVVIVESQVVLEFLLQTLQFVAQEVHVLLWMFVNVILVFKELNVKHPSRIQGIILHIYQ